MLLHRRDVLTLLASSALACAHKPKPRATRHYVLSPVRGERTHALAMLDVAAEHTTTIAMPMLAHSLVGDPMQRNRVVAFGQRPATHSAVIDLHERRVVSTFAASNDRHFYGHGVFSPDAALLFCTETHARTGEGAIIVRDGRTFAIVSELASHGMAPHELGFLRDGKTLVVCNGGRLSLEAEMGGVAPSYSEAPADLSSLAFVDVASGKLLHRATLAQEHAALSLRHMAIGNDDRIALGLRHYPEPTGTPCVALARLNEPITLLKGDARLASLNGLALSVALDGNKLYATHPDGNQVSVWDAVQGTLLRVYSLQQPEGIARSASGEWIVTSQDGRVRKLGASGLQVLPPAASGPNWKHSLGWTA